MKKLLIVSTFLCSGLALGWLSARFMMQSAAGAGSTTQNGWAEVHLTGEGLGPTYEAGYYLWRGKVPPPKNVRLFRRNIDDEGNSLRGDCAIMVEGEIPSARWWVVNTEGAGESGAISAGSAIRESSGEIAIAVSRNPMPGNWLRPGDAGAYALQLVLHDAGVVADEPLVLPHVKRLWC